MVSGVPQVFRRTSPVNVSYDWLDFTSGAGYKRFYGAGACSSATTTLFLTNRVIDSTSIVEASKTTKADASVFDIDFNMTLNVPATIVGNSNFLINSSVSTSVAPCKFVYTIYHVRGGAETQLATSAGCNLSSDVSLRECICLKSASDKQFVKGDILRLSITTSTTNGSRRIWHDPTSRNLVALAAGFGNATTDLTLDVPFKIII